MAGAFCGSPYVCADFSAFRSLGAAKVMKLSTLAWGSRSSRWIRLTGIGLGLEVLEDQPERPVGEACFGLIGEHPRDAEPCLGCVDRSLGGIDDQPRADRDPLLPLAAEAPPIGRGERVEADAIVSGEL